MTRTIAGNPPELDSDPNELEGVPRVRIHNGSSRVVKPGSQGAFAGASGPHGRKLPRKAAAETRPEILRTLGLGLDDGRFPASPRSRLHGRVQGGSLDLHEEARGRSQLNDVQ